MFVNVQYTKTLVPPKWRFLSMRIFFQIQIWTPIRTPFWNIKPTTPNSFLAKDSTWKMAFLTKWWRKTFTTCISMVFQKNTSWATLFEWVGGVTRSVWRVKFWHFTVQQRQQILQAGDQTCAVSRKFHGRLLLRFLVRWCYGRLECDRSWYLSAFLK